MTSSSFKKFVDYKFISKFEYYLESYFNINEEDAEEELIHGMCRYYADKIIDKFNFSEIKSNYENNLKNLNPNKDSIQTKKIIAKEQSKLETFARFKYCCEDIKMGYYDMECLAHLFLIYCKLNKKSLKDIQSNKVYQYLNSAYLRREKIDLNHSITQHAKYLQNAMVLVDYNADKWSYFSVLHNNGTLELPNDYETKLTNEEIIKYRELDDEEKAVFVAEKMFKERLIAEMHSLNNGKVF